MAPYSMDVRKRVARAWDAGMDAETIATTFTVSRAWVHRLIQRRRETDSLAPRRQTTFRRRALTGDQEERLVARRGFSVPKTVHADAQRRPDVAAARRQWRACASTA
jgi:transposase